MINIQSSDILTAFQTAIKTEEFIRTGASKAYRTDQLKYNLLFKNQPNGDTNCYVMGEVIGVGAFATVYEAKLFSISSGEVTLSTRDLVIKTYKTIDPNLDPTRSAEEDKVNFRRFSFQKLNKIEGSVHYCTASSITNDCEINRRLTHHIDLIQRQRKNYVVKSYIIEDVLPGDELFTYIFQRNTSVEEKTSITFELLREVSHLHRLGIIHNDLKPENIKVKLNNGKAKVYICDFGFATTNESTILNKGTPPYYAPEITGKVPVTLNAEAERAPRNQLTDSFAVGLILVELWCNDYVTAHLNDKFRMKIVNKYIEALSSVQSKIKKLSAKIEDGIVDSVDNSDDLKLRLENILKSRERYIKGNIFSFISMIKSHYFTKNIPGYITSIIKKLTTVHPWNRSTVSSVLAEKIEDLSNTSTSGTSELSDPPRPMVSFSNNHQLENSTISASSEATNQAKTPAPPFQFYL